MEDFMEKGPKSYTHSINERRIESEDNFASFMKFEKILDIKLNKNCLKYNDFVIYCLRWRD